jgi:hypothetical protein
LLLTYFLLAPSSAAVPGLGLGAIGAAARVVGYGLLSVQVYEWSNFRFFHLNYGWATLQRIMIAAVVGGGAALILVGLPGLVATRWQAGNLSSLAVSSSLYFGLVGALVLLWPGLAGLSRAEIFSSLHLLLRRLRLTRAATTP